MQSIKLLEEKISLGQVEESLELVNKMDEAYCENINYLNASGVLFFNLKNYNEAYIRFLKAAVCDSLNFDALYNLGLVQNVKGEYVDAIIYINKAMNICTEEELKEELLHYLRDIIHFASQEYENNFSIRFAIGLYLGIKVPTESDYILKVFSKHPKELEMLEYCLWCANDLIATKRAEFFYEDKKLIIAIDGVNIAIDDQDILDTVVAVYKNGEYDFNCNKDCVIWDVGLNVGTTSLRLAGMDHISKIIAMEPVKHTFDKALYNISMNHTFGKKIEPHNFGISDKNQEVEINFDPYFTTRSSIFNYNYLDTKTKTTLQLVKASDFFKQNIEKYVENHVLILKMDCEGSEYSAIMNLVDEDLLKCFSLIEIELHEDPTGRYQQQDLIDIIVENGFLCTRVDSLAIGEYVHVRVNAYRL